MEIRLEMNQRHGHGFQLRVVHGPMNKVYDEEPWNLYEAGAFAKMLLDMVNKETGTSFKLTQVCLIPEDALTANASTDFAAARMLQDIRNGTFELSAPAAADYQRTKIDGEEEILLTARGVVLTCFFVWKDDGNPKSHDGLRRYCEYIAAHGFKGGASKALAEPEALPTKDEAVDWIRRTYARYVPDSGYGLMEYLLGAMT